MASGMIALLPSREDAARLAVPRGEQADELHLTLAYLGPVDEIDTQQLVAFAEAVQAVGGNVHAIDAEGFAIDVFNPLVDESCITLGVSGEGIATVHEQILRYVDTDRFPQHDPWIPHITLRYTDDMDNPEQFQTAGKLADRVGPVRFDRLVLALGDNWYVWPLADPRDDLDVPAGILDINHSAAADAQGESGMLMQQVDQPLVSAEVAHSSALQAGEGGGVAFTGPVEEPAADLVVAFPVLVADAPHLGEETAEVVVAAVNANGWSKLPVAERDTRFAFREATDRLAAHATSIAQFSSWFFWRDPSKPANNRNSYRMPFADVFDDGTVKLVPNAVYSAAAQLSGAHGALPIIPDAEKDQIRRVLDRIYAKFRDMWDDPRQIPPWERAPSPEQEVDVAASVTKEEPMPIILEGVSDEEFLTAVTAGIAPVRPPKAWFADPGFTKPTRMRVTDEGRVFGHIATWNSCHRGMADRCTPPPRDRSGYKGFKTGTLMTAEGELIKVGNLTYGGPHAPLGLAADAARDFYADAGAWFVAGNAGEDQFGPWFAGALPASATEVEAQALRAHPPSGDWRWTDGDYQMIAILAVNTPGFPVEEEEYALAASMDFGPIIAGFGHEEDCDGTCAIRADAAEDEEELRVRTADIANKAEALERFEALRRQRTILKKELPVRSNNGR